MHSLLNENSNPTYAAVGIALLSVLGVWLSPSPIAVLASGSVALLAISCLWRPGEPPILLIPILLQFIEISVKPITTAVAVVALEEMSDFSADLQPALLFAASGLALLIVGLSAGSNGPKLVRRLNVDVGTYRVIRHYSLLVIVIGHILDLFSGLSGGLQQIVLALASVKWAGIFTLAYSTLALRQGFFLLSIVILLEVVLGLTGFFSEFRIVILVAAAAALSVRQWRFREIIVFIVSAALAVCLAIFWSAIKRDYRAFLSQGTGMQIVMQPVDQRLSFIADKIVAFDSEQWRYGVEAFLDRLSYIDFLAVVMERVPEKIPHAGGELSGAVISHILMPRVLFPDKPSVPSDTEVTAYYTGLETAVSADENTSISIGYLGELYIDFGIIGSLIMIFLFGLIYGRGYRALRDYDRTPVWMNYGLCMMVALPLATFGTALIKIVGAIVATFAAAFLMQRLILPRLLIRDARGRPKELVAS